MTDTDTHVRSIQGEQMPADESEIYLSFTGPGVAVAAASLATRKSSQRFVVEATAASDSFTTRADGEERHTRSFKITQVLEFGDITEPEDVDEPTLFDDVAEG